MSRNLRKYITPLLVAAAATVAITAPPTAFAADHQSCNGSGSETLCQSPGNVGIDDLRAERSSVCLHWWRPGSG
jgi:hypothetical protein